MAVVGLLSGCDVSSTAPLAEPVFFDGEIAAGGRNSHTFTLVSTGTIRIQMLKLQEKPIEGIEPSGLDLAVGLGLGRPTGDVCATRYSVLVDEGDIAVFGLEGADFCIQVFDNGTIFGDVIAEYTVSISPG